MGYMQFGILYLSHRTLKSHKDRAISLKYETAAMRQLQTCSMNTLTHS